jgi:hypothetical protein
VPAAGVGLQLQFYFVKRTEAVIRPYHPKAAVAGCTSASRKLLCERECLRG